MTLRTDTISQLTNGLAVSANYGHDMEQSGNGTRLEKHLKRHDIIAVNGGLMALKLRIGQRS
jgi:hypothetical protein